MAIDPTIRDQAYHFFIEEAPELLQVIESGLLSLSQTRNTTTVHNLMRAAHSLKGGAASVGLDLIATLAHRLENIFKALYSDSLEVDTNLENQLLRAYDCLRLPLMQQITTGYFDADEALAFAEPILSEIEQCYGEALTQTDSYIPSSADLGVDMVSSILAIDVAQGLERLAIVVAEPQNYDVAAELKTQLEVFGGFAEILNLPGFGAIATTVEQALANHPDRVLEIAQLALLEFDQNRQTVLAGDRSSVPVLSPQLVELSVTPVMSATPVIADPLPVNAFEVFLSEGQSIDLDFELTDVNEFSSVEKNELPAIDRLTSVEELPSVEELADQEELIDQEELPAIDSAVPFLESVFGDPGSSPLEVDFDELDELNELEANKTGLESKAKFLADQVEGTNFEDTSFEDTGFIEEPIDLKESEITGSDVLSVSSEVLPENDDRIAIEETAIGEIIWHEEKEKTAITGLVPSPANFDWALQFNQPTELHYSTQPTLQNRVDFKSSDAAVPLTIRVDADRLERVNNLIGELIINRNGLSLQNEQLQEILRELLNRFERFQKQVNQFRDFADRMVLTPNQSEQTAAADQNNVDRQNINYSNGSTPPETGESISYSTVSALATTGANLVEFDPLEMDHYDGLYFRTQEILEDLVQLEETVEDISLFARQSNQSLDQQRQSLTSLQNEVKWARMLPLGEVLNRFPRVIRDLSSSYGKLVHLNLVGTDVLVDKAILEKLYDPLLHLLRNAFDHGIEPVATRQQQGKSIQGTIEIRAYHKGNQTVIEVRDDGQGLNIDRIRNRILELGWLAPNQLIMASPDQLLEFIFAPGFSTASQVSELSGRGIGLDVVRSQLAMIKGSLSVSSTLGQGTTFTLYLPLTLTITRLMIGLAGASAFALSADSVEEIITPQSEQVRQSGAQRFLYWREQIIPVYRLVDLLNYACPLPEMAPSRALTSIATPQTWAPPMLILQQEQQFFAIEVDRLVNEQELVIKPFGSAIAAPNYIYGCTILGDGSLIPVIDATALLSWHQEQYQGNLPFNSASGVAPSHTIPRSPAPPQTIQSPTILVVDDAVALRRTLALSLEREGFRVLQARDGWEAIEQLQQSASVRLVICDVEMPNMNGFEFLTHRRQTPDIAKIPVVMLTSRSNEKHRWLAKQLGADDYFTKPYLEQEFLTAIKTIVQSQR